MSRDSMYMRAGAGAAGASVAQVSYVGRVCGVLVGWLIMSSSTFGYSSTIAAMLRSMRASQEDLYCSVAEVNLR